MKKILFFLLTFICLKGFSQSTVLLRGDTIKVYKQGDTATLKVEGEVIITHYKQGSSTDSILRWDPVTKKVRMTDASGISGVNIYNSSGILEGNRTLTGLNNTYSLNFDSLNSWRVQRDGVTRFNMSSTTSSMISQNTSAAFTAGPATAIMNFGANSLTMVADSSNSVRIIAYNESVSNGLLTDRALTPRVYVDSLFAAAGGGTINSGTTGKPAYYVGATTLDDFAAVDYATSGTNMLLTTQNTTDVGLNIKGQSSQTANLLNISSSAGTGDLASIASNGRAYFANELGIGAASSAPLSIKAAITPSYGQMSIASASGSGNAAIVYESYYDAVGTRLMVMGLGHYAGGTDPLYYFANEISGGGVAFRNGVGTTFQVLNTGAAKLNYYGSGTFTGTPTRYLAVDSDGDVIEATASSLKPSLSKGLTLESPGSAEDFGMWKTQVAITVSSINAVVKGSSPSVTINIAFGSDITSLTNVFSSGTAITNTTTGQTVNSGFNDATIPAGSWIRLISTASSGTITQIEVTINYTED